jgi:chromosome segregation ATPase
MGAVTISRNGYIEDLERQLAEANASIGEMQPELGKLKSQLAEARDNCDAAEINSAANFADLRDCKAALNAAVKQRDRLAEALDQIGFYFAGTDHQNIANICLRVLNGESMQDIRRSPQEALAALNQQLS